jgi:tRNA threonylcarbamoyladenosine biosynthesis protein TsaE
LIDLDFETHSAEETVAAGRRIAAHLEEEKNQGLLLILRGDLGAGKTTLVKGIAEVFTGAAADEVTSPTFTLVHEYAGSSLKLYHLDLYRLEEERQLIALGIDEMVAEDNIVLIEWGEKFSSLVARADAEIRLEHQGDDRRSIQLRYLRK